jgi:ABC-type nitrate/sulfonate/bicarbonate transport system substrate-binding protein
MSASARTSDTVVKRIEALRRQADLIAQRCRHDRHRTQAQAVLATLDEAHAWLRGARDARPELVVHIAKMVDDAKRRLIALAGQAC